MIGAGTMRAERYGRLEQPLFVVEIGPDVTDAPIKGIDPARRPKNAR